MPSRKKCSATNRKGKKCNFYAMDNGVCRYHGGRDVADVRPFLGKNVPGRPIAISGKSQSKYLNSLLGLRIEELSKDPEFLDLKDEIGLARATLESILPLTMPENTTYSDTFISQVTSLTEQIRKLTESFVKIESLRKFALTPDEVVRIMRQIVDVIAKIVPEDLMDEVKDAISRIKVR